MPSEEALNFIAGRIIGAAIRVHSRLGPGVLESAYHACLAYELSKDGMLVRAQDPLPILYDDVRIDVGYRLDLLVEDEIIVELKAVQKLLPIHEAQLLSYLRLSGRKLGLLINFHVLRLTDGIKRIVNELSPTGRAECADMGAERVLLCDLCVLCGSSPCRAPVH